MNARWIAAALVVAGCINEDRRLYEVTLAGTITAPGGATGAVHLELHHARRGSGQLETPLGLIDEATFDAAEAIEWTVLVPIDEGEGLVVYGWLDSDGDGLLCAPGSMPEPAGAVEIAGFPAHALSFSLALETPCAGPSALYPP